MTEELEDYILNHIDAEPAVLRKINRDTHLCLLYSRMCSGHLQGRLLKMLVRMINPHRILELGTYSGYSALCLAEGLLSDDARVDTVEIDDELEDFIRENFDKCAWGNRVTLHIGDACEILPKIADKFDLVFIDANKRNYDEYYDLVFDLVNYGGFIIADNTLWDGKVAEDGVKLDAQTEGILKFNDKIAADDRVEKVIVPLRDGLTIIYKKPLG
jgi:caffeoyl-CoA O-methyltransferase